MAREPPKMPHEGGLQCSLETLSEEEKLGLMDGLEKQGVGNDPPSLTKKVVTLKIQGNPTSELKLPVFTSTKVIEVKQILASKLGLDDPGALTFRVKQGCHWRTNLNIEEVGRNVFVSGIQDFVRPKWEYQHPHCIIGGGHIGLKLAMTWLLDHYTNFVLFDRRDEVGGTSWHEQANDTSKLQTEVGVYHLQFHENAGWPSWAQQNPWPTRRELLKHFVDVCDEYGILPYCRMQSNVASMNVIQSPSKDYMQQHYEIVVENLVNKEDSLLQVASLSFFPGNLTIPKRVEYKGEESFQGDIVYGISSKYDYGRCKGNQVVIIGSGAFAVENVRTCTEHKVGKIFMVCRRKTLSMPRVVSWYINQSLMFVSAASCMRLMKPMYDLINVDHYVEYYAVNSNDSRTNVHIHQKSRFGIGDVYYLSVYYGKTEHIIDDVKRVSPTNVHLVSGRVLENIVSILKLLGFRGEHDNDRLMRLKELYGWWCQKDHRRYIVAEPLGVDANNFGSTSFSPGALTWAEDQVLLLYYPKEWIGVRDSGMLPTHVSDEALDHPAYVVQARHGALTIIAIQSLVPVINQRRQVNSGLKRQRMWDCNPIDTFLKAAKEEWDRYTQQFIDEGWGPNLSRPRYPYTMRKMKAYLEEEIGQLRTTIGSDIVDNWVIKPWREKPEVLPFEEAEEGEAEGQE